MTHRCDYVCVCPVHETPLLYCPGTDEHACQDPSCVHAHGVAYEALHDQAMRRLFGQVRRVQEHGGVISWPTSS
jgi:hypothetical protein